MVPRAGALPIGIVLVGLGGVLLFVAFHNVPSSVTNLTGMVGWIASDIRGNVSGKAQPATAGGG